MKLIFFHKNASLEAIFPGQYLEAYLAEKHKYWVVYLMQNNEVLAHIRVTGLSKLSKADFKNWGINQGFCEKQIVRR